MTASTKIRGLLAGVAGIALIGAAIAQGTPPNPASNNAPTGAGQQSSQSTPMGTTGTPAGGGTAAAGGTSGSGAMGPTGSTAAAPSTAAPPTDRPVASVTPRRVRADRN